MSEIPAESLRDAELASLFYDTVKAKWYRRVKADGEFIFTGLSDRFKTTTQIVGDVQELLPNSPLSTRKSLCIHNKGTTTLYLGESGVTSDSADGSLTSGWEVPPSSYFNEEVVRYDECWASHINDMIKVMTPDGSPGLVNNFILRTDYYYADDNFTGIVLKADYIITRKD